MEILIGRNGNRVGAFNEEQVRALLEHGLLAPDDLFWFEGRKSWDPVSLFPEKLPGEISHSEHLPPASGVGKVVPAGYTCCAVAILFAPLLFGVAGLVLGIIALRRGATGHGTAIIALSITCSTVGFLWG